jgi:adenylate cyclase
MAELIAQGERPEHRWRRGLPSEQPVILGRGIGVWDVPWDQRISRRHARLTLRGGQLQVELLPEARNPIYYRGQEVREAVLRPRECFVIGLTTFTFLGDTPIPTVPPGEAVYREAFGPETLGATCFSNPDRRLEVLSRLPEVISQATDHLQLCSGLVSMLLAGISCAELVAIVRVAGRQGPRSQTDNPSELPSVETLYWDERRTRFSRFQLSRRLVREAFLKKQSVLHIWRRPPTDDLIPPAAGVSETLEWPDDHKGGPSESIQEELNREGGPEFTAVEGLDWAFCTPIRGRVSAGWALYVAGSWPSWSPQGDLGRLVQALRAEVKFAEIVAASVAALRDLRELERRQSLLGQFFPQRVLEAVAVEDPDVVLAPRETKVTVLFCDLRGFSREAERHAGNLMVLLNRVGKALGVMTRSILQEGGVIGDFQGDSAMGFWGWPLVEGPWMASVCRAALRIWGEFATLGAQAGGPLAGFRVGIGIATGQAVAGKIGTEDHVKATVFGPVVNLASRLEGLTKLFHVPILVDEVTARAIREEVPPSVARVRRLARVRPYGFEQAVEIAELRPPAQNDPLLTDDDIRLYEEGLDAFLEGEWQRAYRLLRQLPSEDTGADLLIAHIVQHGRIPPPNWDGIIPCLSK